MRKDILKKKHTRLLAKREALKAKGLASSDVNEVRAINAQLEDLNEEISEVEDELAEIENEERSTVPTMQTVPANAQIVNGQIVSQSAQNQQRSENPLESMEYRTAFMAYVQNGTPIPANLRAGDAINSQDTAPAIPLTIMREVINTVRKRYGNLYSKVRKMSIQGGVEFPIGALQATFKWIGESTVSPRQKLDALGKVSFNYYPAEIRIAQSFLSSILTIEAFEEKIAEVIAIAYLNAMDYGIVNATGYGQMLGIVNDPRVTALSHNVSMTAADISDWTAWRKKFFSKLPLGYRNGEFIFPVSTVDSYLETMADSNNNPVFRQATGLEVNDGDAMNSNGRFFGRKISLVEPDILADFDTASNGDIVGIYWQPEEYAINENFGFTMRRYFDEETNEWVDKAIVVVDGKVLNPNGIWFIKKSS